MKGEDTKEPIDHAENASLNADSFIIVINLAILKGQSHHIISQTSLALTI